MAKAETNVFKLSAVLACLRESLEESTNSNYSGPDFTVQPQDFKAAAEIVKFSVEIFGAMKNPTFPHQGEDGPNPEECTSDYLKENSMKIRTMWLAALKNNNDSVILLSAIRRNKVLVGVSEKKLLMVCELACIIALNIIICFADFADIQTGDRK